MKLTSFRTPVSIVLMSCIFVSCSSSIEDSISDYSTQQNVVVQTSTETSNDNWERYFASLDSLDMEFGIYDYGIAVLSNDTSKDDTSTLHKVVAADAVGAIEGWVQDKTWRGALVSGVMASLEEIVDLNWSLATAVTDQPTLPHEPTLPNMPTNKIDLSLVKDSNIAVYIGAQHNSIIRAMAKNGFSIENSTHTEIANEVLAQYAILTKEPITDELLVIAYRENHRDEQVYQSVQRNIRSANQKYMNATKRLVGPKLKFYTKKYMLQTQSANLSQQDKEMINSFACVACSSKALWNIQ